jgi:hypothetical protein
MQNEIRLESLQRLAAGREAEVFAVDDARVLRLGLSSQQRAAVECEALVLAAASAAGGRSPRSTERSTSMGDRGSSSSASGAATS